MHPITISLIDRAKLVKKRLLDRRGSGIYRFNTHVMANLCTQRARGWLLNKVCNCTGHIGGVRRWFPGIKLGLKHIEKPLAAI